MAKLATSFALLVCLFANWSNGTIAQADFPQFRGQLGWGVANGQAIPTTWSAEQNLAWRVAVPGAGWSAPVIVGDRLYLTSAVAEDGRKPKNFADGVKTPQSMGLGTLTPAPNISIAWTVFCLEKNSGEILWQKVIETAKPPYAIHPSNSYATETPVADQHGIYVYFGAIGKVIALNHSGELLWDHDVGVFKTSNNFGTGSSLAIHQGKVFVQNFTEGSADLICFDCASGKELWRNKRDKNATSWSSPLVWDNPQRVELIVSGGEQVDSFDPSSGSRLWTLNKVKAATACSVSADAQHLYFGGSDPFSSGPLFAVNVGGAGDISPAKQNGEFDLCAWKQDRAAPGMASPVSTGQFVYVAEKNILRCYAAESGERLYQERVPNLSMINASPLIVGDQLLLVDEAGAACVVQTGPEFKVLGSGKLEDTFWSTPAISQGAIYLRGLAALYCIRTPQ